MHWYAHIAGLLNMMDTIIQLSETDTQSAFPGHAPPALSDTAGSINAGADVLANDLTVASLMTGEL
jgi:hypothetical protein